MININSLTDYTKSIYYKVEKLFKIQPVIRIVEEDFGGNAEAGILNSVPDIKIKAGTELNETIFCHELNHLLMKGLSGYHIFNFDTSLQQKCDEIFNYYDFIMNKYHALLQHSFFYHEMIKNGFSPTESNLKDLNKIIDEYPNCYDDKTKNAHIIMDIWEIMLGIDDPAVNTKYALYFFNKHFNLLLKKAEEVILILGKFTNPSDEPIFFCKIFPIIFNIDKIKYRIDDSAVIYFRN